MSRDAFRLDEAVKPEVDTLVARMAVLQQHASGSRWHDGVQAEDE